MTPDDTSPNGDRAKPAGRDGRSVRSQSRAIELLDRLLAANLSTVDELASALMVSVERSRRVAEIAAVLGNERFLKDVQTPARLKHPLGE